MRSAGWLVGAALAIACAFLLGLIMYGMLTS